MQAIHIGSNAISRTMWKEASSGTLPAVTAYIVSYSDTWTGEKQKAIWNDKMYEDGLVTDKKTSPNAGATKLDNEAIDYKSHDAKVRSNGMNATNKTDLDSVFTKVDQETKQYIVGPFKMTYNDCVYGNVAFGGISEIVVVGYNKSGDVMNSNMSFKISLENGATGSYSSPITPKYFTPNTSETDRGVDRTEQYYPASGQNFQILLDDPNGNVTDENKKIVSISVKVNFKYMLANGEYSKLNGVRYGIHVSEEHVSNGTDHKHVKDKIYTCNNKPINSHKDKWVHVKHSMEEDCPAGCHWECTSSCKHIHNIHCSYYNTYYTCTDCTKVNDKIQKVADGQTIMVADADRTIYEESITLSSKISIGIDLGGYVWVDGLVGKESNFDGLNNTSKDDIPIQNIRVILYNSKNQKMGETKTDDEGYYLFTDVEAMEKYYVAFEYNGQLYVPTTYMSDKNKWQNTSKATEKAADRDALDNRFAEIGASPHNYKRANGSYNRAYSQYELMGFKLNEKGEYIYNELEHYIDGFYEVKDGNIIATNKINRAKASSGDSQKVNFINDCKILAYTKSQKATSYDLYPTYDRFIINKTEKHNYTTGKQAREAKFSQNSVSFGGKKYVALYPSTFFIDLGLVRRTEVDLALRKDILYAVTKINSKTEIYQYDKRANNDNYWLIEYRMRDPKYYGGMYVNGIYKSDYEYRGENTNGGNNLEVYVTYKITVRNSSVDTLGKITEIVDYYNNKDYEYQPKLSWAMYKTESSNDNKEISLNKSDYYNMIDSKDLSKIPNAKTITSSDKSKSNVQQDIANKMDAIYITGLENKKLAVGEQAYIYLTFKVYTDNKGNINLDEGNEFKMNYAEINGYATYYTGNIDLPNGVTKTKENPAGLIDINSTPGNLSLSDISGDNYEKNFENDTDRAKGIQIKKDDTAVRKISGTVWEDQRTVTVDGAVIGDGIRNIDEKGEYSEIGIQGVTVQLFERLKDGKEYLWQTTTTNEHGEYTFSDFIPGDYIVRFKYGNNESTVLTTNNGGANNVSYNGQDFKSTVYQKDINTGKEITEETEEKYNIRAADTFGENVSDAKDIWENKTISVGRRVNNILQYENVVLQGRKTANKYLANGVKNKDAEVLASPYATDEINRTYIAELIQNTQMAAETGIIVIECEYDRQSTLGDSDEKASNGEQNYANGNHINGAYEIKNLDFGLTERPKAQLELNKKVTNVKIILANQNVLFDANDTVANLAWIRHQDYSLKDKKVDGKYHEYYNESKEDKKYNRYYYKTDIQDMINNTLYSGGKNGKNGLIQVTMDSELMHGATIQITYELEVTNVGEIDYTGKDFYYKATGAKEDDIVTTTANLLVDYVENNLQYRTEDNSDWQVVKAKVLLDTENVNKSLESVINQYNTILVTNKINDVLKPGKSAKKELVLTQTITSQNTRDNMTYQNTAEILQTSNSVGRRMAFSIVGNQKPTEKPTEVDSAQAERVVILPPFGQIYLYFGLGIVVLAVITGAVVFIKKKVLNK